MATSQPQQPLVCTSLHLPPDPQPFLRIHEISLYVYLPNFERLRLDLEAAQDIDPEIAKDFYETRQVLTKELHKVFLVLNLAQELAEQYHQVLDALEQRNSTREVLFDVSLVAGGGAMSTKEGQKAMTVFRREFERVVERVTSIKDKKGRKSSLISAKNIQSVSEIITAINECDALLQQCFEQFKVLEKQTHTQGSIDSNPPSEEETQVMRAKWRTFFDAINDVWKQGFEIANEISWPILDGRQYSSESPEPRQRIPLWRALFQRQDKRDLVHSRGLLEAPRRRGDPNSAIVASGSSHEMRPDASDPADAAERAPSEHAATPDAAPAHGRARKDSGVSFWRKIFRRINPFSSLDVPERVESSDDTRGPHLF